MSVHTFSSRDFTRDVSSAKRAAAEGPVFITDRGRPAYALLNYRRLLPHGRARRAIAIGGDGRHCWWDAHSNLKRHA
jgi:hypothetical protein